MNSYIFIYLTYLDVGQAFVAKDVTNLQSLLSYPETENYGNKQKSGDNKDSIPSFQDTQAKAQKINNMFSFNEKKDTISSPQDTNNYLRSNLAELTPESSMYNNNYQQ